MQIRLNKFLSQAGVASRREADRMITEGRVKVNGKVIQALGQKVDDRKNRVEVDGKKIRVDKNLVYLILNKPSGCLVTLKDPFQRPTVMDLLPPMNKRIFPVGRLDFDSEGLLLLTNDGELAHRLMHPRYKIKKTYRVEVEGQPDLSSLTRLAKGIYLDQKKTAPAKITRLASSPKKTLLRIEIFEGRKREIKRMFEAIGHRVLRLQRIKFASITLTNLKQGQWRYLSQKEVDKLKKLVQ